MFELYKFKANIYQFLFMGVPNFVLTLNSNQNATYRRSSQFNCYRFDKEKITIIETPYQVNKVLPWNL